MKYISMDDIVDICQSNITPLKANRQGVAVSALRRVIEAAKEYAVEAEPVKHGRWIPTEYDGYADGAPVWDKWECSECGYEHSGEEDTLTSFCLNCFARMDGGTN